jgi:hypothetical protein
MQDRAGTYMAGILDYLVSVVEATGMCSAGM